MIGTADFLTAFDRGLAKATSNGLLPGDSSRGAVIVESWPVANDPCIELEVGLREVVANR